MWEDELKNKQILLASFIDKQESGEYQIFTRKNVIEIKEVIPIIKSLLKQQREICVKKAEAFSRGYGVTTNFIDNQSEIILNAPEPTDNRSGISVEFTCKCGEQKGWITENVETKPCPNCGRKYIGEYNQKKLTIEPKEKEK